MAFPGGVGDVLFGDYALPQRVHDFEVHAQERLDLFLVAVEIRIRFPDEVVNGCTINIRDGLIGECEPTVTVLGENQVGRDVEDLPQEGLLPFYDLIALFAFGDINAGTDVPDEALAGHELRHAHVQHTAIFAVMTTQAVFHGEWFARVERANIAIHTTLPVFRMNALGPAVALFLLQGPPGEFQPAAIEVNAALVRPRHPDQYRRRVCQQLEP